jgi:hypothetical protein
MRAKMEVRKGGSCDNVDAFVTWAKATSFLDLAAAYRPLQ